MRIFFTLLLLIPVVGIAQPDGWIREYFKDNSHYVIGKQKNKVGLYNNARGEFTIEPHKGFIIHLPEPQLLLDVYPKDEKVDVYHYYDRTVQELESEHDSGNYWLGHILGKQWEQKLKVTEFEKEIEGEVEDGYLITADDAGAGNTDHYHKGSRFNYYFEGDYLRLEFYHLHTLDNYDTPIKSIITGEDSINANNEIVYEPKDEKYILNSGYFNLKTGKWEIPPVYQGTNEWEDIVGCYYWPTLKNEDKLSYGGMVYAFYLKTKNGIVPTQHEKYQGFGFPLDLWPFEGENVWYDYDSIYVYHQNKKGVGMYKIPLSGKSMVNGYTRFWAETEGKFEVEELLEPKYEYILRSGNMHYFTSPTWDKWQYTLAYKGKNKFDILISDYTRLEEFETIDTLIADVVINQSIELRFAELMVDNILSVKENIVLIDDSIVYRPAPQTTEEIVEQEILPNKKNETDPGWTYRAELTERGHILINAYVPEFSEHRVPIMSLSNPANDSIDAQGNVVYYPPDPGLYASGIYNTANLNWFLPPFNAKVAELDIGYIIQRPVFIEGSRNLDHFVYDLLLKEGLYEFRGWTQKDLDHPQNGWYKEALDRI
ncbi:MAG: hypothetical protein HUJ25_11035 [Crocinitomicaceae bacterium]|nr:hypothetical protein [Crocinitomicaceae bacterium]